MESKYSNKRLMVGGVVFDSRKEYQRYCELRMLERAGYISNLQRQVKYELIPAQREPDIIGKRGGVKKGKLLEKECSYYADFVYMQGSTLVVEDAKGCKTKEYIIKRKLMLYIHGIRIKEV